MPGPLPSLLIAFSAAVLGALFVAADAALADLSSARIAALLEQTDRPHRAALSRYRDHASGMHATYTAGRVLCAAVTAVLLAEVIEDYHASWTGTLLAVTATLLIYAPASSILVTLARQHSDTWGSALATYLRPFEWLLLPAAAPLGWLSSKVARNANEPVEADATVASAEVEYFVDEVERSGVVGSEPAEIIRNVLEFEDRRARDVMLARGRIEAIDLATPILAVQKLVADSGHSRYPVFEGQLDNVVGILVAKDVFKSDSMNGPAERAAKTLSDIVRRDVIFVPEQQKLMSLLKDMRQKRQHLAVVVDEFGGTSGIITMEDIIEEIIGDIRDEHDEAEPAPIQELGSDRWLVAGSVKSTDLGAYLGFDLGETDGEQTLAEVFDGSASGTSHEKWGLTIHVTEVKSGRIERVELERPPLSSMRPPEVV